MKAQKMSFEEFLDWIEVMTPEQLKIAIEVGERKLAELRLRESPDIQPQA